MSHRNVLFLSTFSVTEVETTRELISLLLTRGLFLLTGDRVSNSISQVFIYYFPFQSRGIFFFYSPNHLHNERERARERERERKKMRVLQLPSVAALDVVLQLNYKILLPFSVKITHCRRPYVIWTGGFVTEIIQCNWAFCIRFPLLASLTFQAA